MAQSGFTPILIYSSTTASQAPSASNLTNSTLGSELAINITDGKLFYKDNANVVQVIGWKTVPTTAGGTGLTTYSAGDLLYFATGTALSRLAIGTAGRILTSSGTAPQWTDATSVAVTSISFGSTGLTPSTATQGAVTVAGTLNVANGGTGLTSVTANRVPYGNGTSALQTSGSFTFDGSVLTVGGSISASTGRFITNRASATSATTDANIQFQIDGTTQSTIGVPASNTIGFYVSTTESLRLNSSGGIENRTMAQGFQLLDGATKYGAMYFANGYLNFETYQSGNAWMKFTHVGGGETEFRSGSNYNTNNVWGGLSDVSLKENIVDATPKLDDLMKIKIRNYNFIADDKKTKQIGVVAQEVEKVFPGLVDADSDGVLSVKYTVFIPMLIKAMQEQQAQIKELQSQIANSKGI